MPPKKQEMSPAEIIRMTTEGLQRAALRPNIWGYRPHEKQIKFHKSRAKQILYIGGNRSGKTVGGVNEDIWWLQGNHPYKETPPPPVRGRVIGVDFDNGIERILKPAFAQWLPPSALKNGSWTDSYTASTRTLTLENGSTLEFMSYVQSLEKFAGTSRHFVHFDEEPPKSIFTENKARLIDTGGSLWITETPVEGMTWVYDEIYLPGVGNLNPLIEVIEVDMMENPYVSTIEKEQFLSGLGDLERRARGKGEFVQLGGLVFKGFGPVHVVSDVDYKALMGLRQWASMDHGYNAPTAWLWHAVYPDGSVLTFDEHYENGWTVAQHASRVHLMNQEHGRPPQYYVGDPAIKQRNAETGHSIQFAYQKEGIPIVLANNEVRGGIDRMNDYLRLIEGRPSWRISSRCPNLIREIQRYRWKTWSSAKLRDENNVFEEPHKKDDHAVDSARYFFSFMPELKKPPEYQSPTPIGQMLDARIGQDPRALVFDDNFRRDFGGITEWTAHDPTVGIF